MTRRRTTRPEPGVDGSVASSRPARLLALAGSVALWALAPATPASAQDEAGARAAVEQLFDGMRTADEAKVRAVFAAAARFAVLDDRDGAPSIRSQGVEGWLGAIGESGGRWDEQIYDVEARVDGRMASVWAPYTFYLDGEISHCGINSIELLHDGEGWKVTQISDTRRREGCPDPLGSGA